MRQLIITWSQVSGYRSTGLKEGGDPVVSCTIKSLKCRHAIVSSRFAATLSFNGRNLKTIAVKCGTDGLRLLFWSVFAGEQHTSATELSTMRIIWQFEVELSPVATQSTKAASFRSSLTIRVLINHHAIRVCLLQSSNVGCENAQLDVYLAWNMK